MIKCVLAQHYFTIPLKTQDTATDPKDVIMRMWCVSVPFEVVCVTDQADEDENTHSAAPPRQRPLLTVDFGHAVWLDRRCSSDTGDYERAVLARSGDDQHRPSRWSQGAVSVRQGKISVLIVL